MPYKNSELELENLLSATIEAGASDLHIIPGFAPTIRIHSQLFAIEGKDILSIDQVVAITQIMLDQKRYGLLLEKRQLDFSYSYNNNRFRINAYFQKGSIALALRYIPNVIKTLEQLSLPEVLKKFTSLKQGLVLVVGPTGHGKSTTLASLINYINKTRTEHIITIEDPIEFLFVSEQSLIQQREIGSDAESFSKAIESTLREDANVVMVGEMRDLESISSTITVAETGHLVFATLHTNTASQTIERIIDGFPSDQQSQIRGQLADILSGIISIRLVNKIGGGRVPAVEVLITNDATRNLIRESRTYELVNVIHTGRKEGMISLDQSLAELVSKNISRMEDVNGYIVYKDVFESNLKKNN